MVQRSPSHSSLQLPIAASALVHAVAIGAVLALRAPTKPAPPPVYKVDLVAAPTGERAIGAVTPATTTPAAPAPPAADRAAPSPAATKVTSPSRKAEPARATPGPREQVAKQQPVSTAGAKTGGTGADVATVHTEGTEFPYPGYLSNIVRQVARNFTADARYAGLRAEVFFFIHRDGTVSDVRLVRRSGVYQFDLEAMGAIEAAARGFGPLPTGFADDVLPVTFSFDPSLFR